MPILLFAWDVDGTLECGTPPGPVKIEMLLELKKNGNVIVIVSDSQTGRFLWEGQHKLFIGKPSQGLQVEPAGIAVDQRCKALYELKSFYYVPDREQTRNDQVIKCIYVSDNVGDSTRALMAGYVFYKPDEFVERYISGAFK